MLKVPPHNLEAEQSVLWSLLIDKDWFLTISDIITHEDFYDENNSIIFEIIFNLYKLNKPIDLITVKNKLSDKKILDKIWWLTYLTELTEIVPTTSNIFEYATIVKNKSVLRRLIRTWNEIISYWYSEDEKLNELLEKSEKSLFSVTQTFIRNKLVHINEILTWRYEEFSEIHENPEAIKAHRLNTWYVSLDEKVT